MSRPPNEELKLTAQVPEAAGSLLACRLLYERRGSTRTLRLDGRP